MVYTVTATGTDPSAVTYNGVSMTRVGSGIEAGTRKNNLWYLVNPASGSNTISVTFSGGFLRVAAASYTGVNSSGQPNTSNTATTAGGSPISCSVTTTVDNCWLMGVGAPTNTFTAAGTGTVVRIASGGNTDFNLFDSNSATTPAGSDSLSFTYTGNGAGLLVAAFAPTASAVNSNFFMFM